VHARPGLAPGPGRPGAAALHRARLLRLHPTGAAGTPIAPDLSRVGRRDSEADLTRLLRDPAIHKPGAHMRKLALTEAEARALAAYLATLR
jgi:cytochrome c1